MGRKKLHDDPQAARAERDKGRKRSGKSGKRYTKSRNGFFVAWDGEGRDTTEILPNVSSKRKLVDFDTNGQVYATVANEASKDTIYRHEMNVFAYSNEDGSIAGGLRHEDRRLTTDELLHCIGEGVKAAGPLAIHVSFSFTYDVTHILYDMEREQVQRALSESRKRLDHYGRYKDYIIKYRPRKQLYIGKLRDSATPYRKDGAGAWHLDFDWSVTLYDTYGFFQQGFLAALKSWGVGTDEELQIIRDGKEGRSNFSTWSMDNVVLYNNLELSLLCQLMQKVRYALLSEGLYLSRWDGAGAVASALYSKELSKDYMRSLYLPVEVEKAAYHSYAGGRSECIQQGAFLGPIYRYDINSAYPDAMRTIPDLSNGIWEKCYKTDAPQDFALYHIRWAYTDKSEPFLPFFYRDSLGSIFFPPFGENWIWGVELKAAIAHCTSLRWEIKECWKYTPYSDARPFAFIENYYQRRLEIKQRLKNGSGTDDDKGRSLVIKLGLNSLYGKTIQKVGVKRDEKGIITYPPFYNICIGAYITAYTRAKLYTAAAQDNTGIILFATDGILSTSDLSLCVDNTIGGWEADTLDGVVMLQGGIYWLLKDGKWSEKSRGIDRATDAGEEHRCAVIEGWKTKQGSVSFPLRRFIGIKYSSLTSERWALRGAWITDEKKIKLRDAGKKRQSTPIKSALHKQLYTTDINWPDYDMIGERLPMSNPRVIPEPTDDSEEIEE